MPYHQVITFQAIAPISAPKTTWWSTTPGSTMPLPTVAATFRWKMKIATKLKKAANDDRLLRLAARRWRRRWRSSSPRRGSRS